MVIGGLWAGGGLPSRQTSGLIFGFGGLIALWLPGLWAPPLYGSLLMLAAGVAWGIYALRGKGTGDPTRVTAGNFLRAASFAAGLSLAMFPWGVLDVSGVWYAVSSGALASGVGYAIWYTALRGLKATSAATVQLSVPVIAAVGGIIFLNEPVTPRLLIAATAILGRIGLALLDNWQSRHTPNPR